MEESSIDGFQERSHERDSSGTVEMDGLANIEEEQDLPPLDLFLNNRNLLKIRTVIEHLKTSKSKKKNILKEGLLFHGPAGTGKFVLAQILSKESGWNLIALEAKNLAQGHHLFEEDEDIDKDSVRKELQIITKDLKCKENDDKNIHIKKTLKALLRLLGKAPTILFIHNIEKLIDNNDSSILMLFTDLFKDFRPLFLVFLIATTRNSDLISNQSILEMVKPMHIDLPDYNRRDRIMHYYFQKHLRRTDNFESEISEDVLEKLLTATENFSGSDIEEMVLNAACALSNHIINKDKVSSFFIAKNVYDFKNRRFSSMAYSIVFPWVYVFNALVRPIFSSDAEEYLLSFCAIKQDEIQYIQTVNLKDKISRKQQLWDHIILISGKGINYGTTLGAYVFKAGKCALLVGKGICSAGIIISEGPVGLAKMIGGIGIGAGKVLGEGIIASHLVQGALQASGEESKRIATEKIQEWFPPKKDEFCEK